VFVLLEAARLVEPVPSAPVVRDEDKSALVIGLGIGTAPNAMIAHGINTTIVELDPVVHAYATKYFDLSPQHTAVIDDAVSYVSEKSVSAKGSFDYIMHDVFTGGAEPVYLFTTEFMQGLYELLKDDGSVAINYAGDLSLGSTRLVLNTIHAIFLLPPLPRPTRSRNAEAWRPGLHQHGNLLRQDVARDYVQGAGGQGLFGQYRETEFLVAEGRDGGEV
jgi:hypothetical protein